MDDAKRDLIRAWLVKSRNDLDTARQISLLPEGHLDTAIYHCQQAAEKAVKAFLIHHGARYERTHDIEVLVDLASAIEPTFSQLADPADALTPYASRFRYPNAAFAMEPQAAEFDEALQPAQRVFDFVFNLLPTEARP